MEEEANKKHHAFNPDMLPSFVPKLGMEFRNSDEAWAFWLSYGGQKGFEVRKRYTNKRPSDGKITSCKFVCANEGHRLKDKRDHLTKCPQAETRTDCQVYMNLIMDRKKEILKVTGLVLEHNHQLHLPETLHLMVSQHKISDLQAFEIETADDAGIGPKVASQFGKEAHNDAAHAHMPNILVESGENSGRCDAPVQALVADGTVSEYYMRNLSFTQMLMGSITDDDFY